MDHKPTEIMDRTCAYRKNEINVLFHIILYDFHGPVICLKAFGIQDQYLAPVVDVFHQFLCCLVTVCVTDQKRGNIFSQISV